MERIVAAFILALGMILAAGDLQDQGRYQFIGASPKGVIVFDGVTGNVVITAPLFAGGPTTTEPQE